MLKSATAATNDIISEIKTTINLAQAQDNLYQELINNEKEIAKIINWLKTENCLYQQLINPEKEMVKYENLLQTQAELCQQLLKNEEKIIKHQTLINKLNTDNTIIIKNDNLSNIKTIIKLLKSEENLPQQLIIADKKEVITENTPKAEIDKINLLDLQNKILNVDQLKFSRI